MTDLHRSENVSELELRGSDGRTLIGLAVPFNTKVSIGGRFVESFAPGSFRRSITERLERIKLLNNHNAQALPVGRLTAASEVSEGLRIEARISRTAAGDDLLELIKDRSVDGLSIGFEPLRSDWTRDRSEVVHREVRLREVSVCAFGMYPTALISHTRSDAATAVATPAVSLGDDPRAWAFKLSQKR
jgi:uncharacterized protein